MADIVSVEFQLLDLLSQLFDLRRQLEFLALHGGDLKAKLVVLLVKVLNFELQVLLNLDIGLKTCGVVQLTPELGLRLLQNANLVGQVHFFLSTCIQFRLKSICLHLQILFLALN